MTPAYFRALGIPILQGRTFDDHEITNGDAVVVVDERLAARLWPGESALGKLLATGSPDNRTPPRWHQVVGIVGAIRGPLSEGEPFAFLYVPWPQTPALADVFLIGRGRGTDQQLLRSLRLAASRADANIGVLDARMVSGLVDEQRYTRRLAATLLGFCALSGLALAASGLYGVLAYAVMLRRRELGIRAALGAQRRDLVRLVILEGVAVAGVGSLVGIPVALEAIRITSHYLVPVPPISVVSLSIAALTMGAIAVTASYLPARRAARVDPIEVLRSL